VSLMLYDKALHHYKYDLTCDPSFLRESFCFDPNTASDGDFVYATVSGFQPDQPWEVYPLLLDCLCVDLSAYSCYISDLLECVQPLRQLSVRWDLRDHDGVHLPQDRCE